MVCYIIFIMSIYLSCLRMQYSLTHNIPFGDYLEMKTLRNYKYSSVVEMKKSNAKNFMQGMVDLYISKIGAVVTIKKEVPGSDYTPFSRLIFTAYFLLKFKQKSGITPETIMIHNPLCRVLL